MVKFQDLYREFQEEMDLQSDRLDHLTTCNFDWLDRLLVEVQPLVTNSDESDNPEVQLTTSNQTESIIMPLSDTDMTLASHIDVFQDICSNESLLSMDSALSSSQLAAEDLGSISKTYEMSEFASELTTSAQLFRQKWKESLKKNPQ